MPINASTEEVHMSLATRQLWLHHNTTITCPHCAQEFPLDRGFGQKALEQLAEASAAAISAMRNAERANVERLAEQSLALQLEELQKALGERDRALADKARQVTALRDEQLQMRKEREMLKDEKAALALDVQKQVDEQIQRRESIVRAQEQQRGQLEKAELQKKLDDAVDELAAAQRKMEQGSQQLQGEVLELVIEEGLRRAFPLDAIEEVKKGQRGGDVLQRVITRGGQAAGTMLWETKRAKEWGPQWIAKLKEDMRACGAAVGILVTMPAALPKDWPPGAYFGLYEDVWVTQASTAIGMAEALRSGLLDLHRQRAISAGKGEKMEALYDYLTSPQFAHKLKAVYDTFKKMREELESEKNVTMQRWARREKQLQAGVGQLLGIGGEIQGLSQQELPLLELENDAAASDSGASAER